MKPTPPPQRRRIKVHISLHPAVKTEAQHYAELEQRSLSEMIERLLERELERVRPLYENQN